MTADNIVCIDFVRSCKDGDNSLVLVILVGLDEDADPVEASLKEYKLPPQLLSSLLEEEDGL